ncbi:hypothetical protein SAMN05518801_12413 [Novosphingobium sp. CF614]|uniref:hypothetical protein n=1 Tax=Novosphingobium sp. CF614 TaxID=1884364 RepID=UPI0008DEC9A1|nr:hypothetical protein [Novosphingobium sp. CF614]SFG41638.1 hypothetical protein SAMN05518801_12413 [Novosphingobium sp. CF614]
MEFAIGGKARRQILDLLTKIGNDNNGLTGARTFLLTGRQLQWPLVFDQNVRRRNRL